VTRSGFYGYQVMGLGCPTDIGLLLSFVATPGGWHHHQGLLLILLQGLHSLHTPRTCSTSSSSTIVQSQETRSTKYLVIRVTVREDHIERGRRGTTSNS
jgi:hypothetical protein